MRHQVRSNAAVVERATPKDIESICRIDALVTGNRLRSDFIAEAVSRGDCLIARIDGATAAFVVLDRRFIVENFFISLLIVHPDFRRKGIAKKLIGRAEKECPLAKIFTSTNQSNSIMKSLLQSLGYDKSGEIENLDEGDPEIIFFKRLDN